MRYPNGLHLPKQFPNNNLLKKVLEMRQKQLRQKENLQQSTVGGPNQEPSERVDPLYMPSSTGKPHISFRMQERMRNVCAMAGLDPSEIGLPSSRRTHRPSSSNSHSSSLINRFSQMVLKQADRLLVLLSFRLILLYRRSNIEEKMAIMDEKIAQWRADQALAKKKAKSNVPF